MTTSFQAFDHRLPRIGALARATTILFGAMLALQSSQDFDTAKVVYMGVAALALVGSVSSVYQSRADSLVGFARPWLVASLVAAGIVGISLPVAIIHGTPVSTWIRDAA